MALKLDDLKHLPRYDNNTMDWPPKIVERADVIWDDTVNPPQHELSGHLNVGIVGVVTMHTPNEEPFLLYSANLKPDGVVRGTIMMPLKELADYRKMTSFNGIVASSEPRTVAMLEAGCSPEAYHQALNEAADFECGE